MLGLDVFVAFTAVEAFGLPPPLFVAFRVLVLFKEHYGRTLVAFTVFLLLMECLGWMLVKFTVF